MASASAAATTTPMTTATSTTWSQPPDQKPQPVRAAAAASSSNRAARRASTQRAAAVEEEEDNEPEAAPAPPPEPLQLERPASGTLTLVDGALELNADGSQVSRLTDCSHSRVHVPSQPLSLVWQVRHSLASITATWVKARQETPFRCVAIIGVRCEKEDKL